MHRHTNRAEVYEYSDRYVPILTYTVGPLVFIIPIFFFFFHWIGNVYSVDVYTIVYT